MIQPLCSIVQNVGMSMMSFYHKKYKTYIKGDGSMCTDVDYMSESLLKQHLSELLLAPIISEESLDDIQIDIHENTYYWVIDPLDGTKNFIDKNPCFALSVALMKGLEIVCAVSYAPAYNWMVAVERSGQVTWFGEHPFFREKASDALYVVTRRSSLYAIVPMMDEIKAYCTLTNKLCFVEATGSMVLDGMLTAVGYFDIALYAEAYWWDCAASVLLMTVLGKRAISFDGLPIQYRPMQSVLLGVVPDMCT